MKLGEKLQKLRKARGWSQEELAGELGVSRQAVSRWESDETLPDAANILKLSDLFGVTTDYLLRESQTETTAATAVCRQTPTGKKLGFTFWGKVMTIGSAACFAVVWLLSTLMETYEWTSWVENGTLYEGGRPGYSLAGFIDVYHLEPLMWVLFCVAVAGLALWLTKDEGIRDIARETKGRWKDN